jgi:arylsulfatase A-like enzyme
MKHASILATAAFLLAPAAGVTAAPQVHIGSTTLKKVPTPGLAPRRRLDRPNILFVLLDDLGIEQLEMYGLEYDPGDIPPPKTQWMDALREQGILFTNAYVDPLCSPTRSVTLTGRYGFRTGLGKAATAATTPDDFAISDDNEFVAQLIEDVYGASFARGFFGKWHLTGKDDANDCDAVFPTNRGFEVFQGQMRNNQGTDPDLGSMSHFRWRKVSTSVGDEPVCPTTETVPADPEDPIAVADWSATVNRVDAGAWMNAQERPFFAYVAYNPPHEPLSVPGFALLSKSTRNRMRRLGYSPGQPPNTSLGDPDAQEQEVYRAMVEAVDTEVGRLLAELDPQTYANTMVIVMDDNGTPGDRIPSTLNGTSVPSKQGKRGVYELGTRVPLIVSGPLVPSGAPTGGWTADGLVAGVDVWRTIADLAGITDQQIAAILDTKGAPDVDSVSFVPIIEDPSDPGHREYAYCEEFAYNGVPNGGCGTYATMRRAINKVFDESWGSGHYKYVWKEFDDHTVVEELYRLDGPDNDWLEQSDLYPPAPGTEEEQAYLALKAEMQAIYPDTTVEICQD